MKQEHALGRAASGTAANVDFSGVWINELQSKVTLVQTGNRLAGTYESAVSGTGKKTLGDLQGYVNGDLISFVVRWGDFQAITTWVGQLNPKYGVQTIDTLWQMTKQVEVGGEWASINAGADYFTRP